jgi:beta-glucosidase-like glycosyl hydrolase
VFLTSRSFPANSTVSDIRRTVDELQAVRREAGLPPLWIATDQEGGPVAKLSPPLSRQPALHTLLEDLDGPDLAHQPARAAEIICRVTAYADAQGKELAAAGINLNFAPVVDLRPSNPPDALDFHSRIATRALAADPATVALVGETYVRTLAKHGVTSVLKHFPGLGRVPADTHHFAATLNIPAHELAASDWLPFRQISANTGTGMMLGHVRVGSLDPDHPASCSSAVVRLLREDWGFRGLLVTDDFSMAPISHGPGGIARAVKQSMAAGVDLIFFDDHEATTKLKDEHADAIRAIKNSHADVIAKRDKANAKAQARSTEIAMKVHADYRETIAQKDAFCFCSLSRSQPALDGAADDGGFVEGLLAFPFQGEDGGTSFERCEDRETSLVSPVDDPWRHRRTDSAAPRGCGRVPGAHGRLPELCLSTKAAGGFRAIHAAAGCEHQSGSRLHAVHGLRRIWPLLSVAPA